MQREGVRTCDGGVRLRTERHDILLHAKAEVQRRLALDMADAEGGPTGDGDGLICYPYKQTHLFQRRG